MGVTQILLGSLQGTESLCRGKLRPSKVSAYCLVGTDQLLNVKSTVSLNFPQPSSMLIFGWEMSWKCNNNQPKLNFSTTIQPNINQVRSWRLKNGWNLVDFRLRSWFLVNRCYIFKSFSTKYQRWYLVICAHWVKSNTSLRLTTVVMS